MTFQGCCIKEWFFENGCRQLQDEVFSQWTFLAVKNRSFNHSATPPEVCISAHSWRDKEAVYWVGTQFSGPRSPKIRLVLHGSCLNPPFDYYCWFFQSSFKAKYKTERKTEKNIRLQEHEITINNTNPNTLLTSVYCSLDFSTLISTCWTQSG